LKFSCIGIRPFIAVGFAGHENLRYFQVCSCVTFIDTWFRQQIK
jgi:hypothetical protein